MTEVSSLTSQGLSRRLSNVNVEVAPDRLMQPLDVDVRFDNRDRRPHPHLNGYFTYGVDAALEVMSEVKRLGLQGVMVRVLDDPATTLTDWCDARRTRWAITLSTLSVTANQLGISLVVDPFSAALQPTGVWALSAPNGTYDALATRSLITSIAAITEETDCSGIITLGRVPDEVRLTRQAAPTLPIWSFSTNSETASAYLGHSAQTITGQKVLTGRSADMLFWALMDMLEGTSVCAIKPSENFHVLARLRELINSEDNVRALVDSYRHGSQHHSALISRLEQVVEGVG